MDDRHEADRGTVIYFYIKPYAEPENNRLHFFGCTPVFEELESVFGNIFIMAQQSDGIARALEGMTINFD